MLNIQDMKPGMVVKENVERLIFVVLTQPQKVMRNGREYYECMAQWTKALEYNPILSHKPVRGSPCILKVPVVESWVESQHHDFEEVKI